MPYEYLDHQADLGIRGIGNTPQEAFSEGAQAMLAAMADLSGIRCEQEWTQHCTAPDIASLFVEWLNELLYQREVYGAILWSHSVEEVSSVYDDVGLDFYDPVHRIGERAVEIRLPLVDAHFRVRA